MSFYCENIVFNCHIKAEIPGQIDDTASLLNAYKQTYLQIKNYIHQRLYETFTRLIFYTSNFSDDHLVSLEQAMTPNPQKLHKKKKKNEIIWYQKTKK
jgi:hypothetical protein